MSQPQTIEGVVQVEAPPLMTVSNVWAVFCNHRACNGVIGMRPDRKGARELRDEHKDKHIRQNKATARVVQQFNAARAEGDLPENPDEVPPRAVETKDLLDDMVPASTAEVVKKIGPAGDLEEIPVHPDPYGDRDNGFLDWHWGSDVTGRDKDKRWHRKCGGEVIRAEELLVCTLCGTADTKSGKVG